jgi:hypothetical protein
MIEADGFIKFIVKHIASIEYDGKNRDFIHDITVCQVSVGVIYDRGDE